MFYCRILAKYDFKLRFNLETESNSGTFSGAAQNGYKLLDSYGVQIKRNKEN